MALHHLLVSLRNAFQAHDSVQFEDLLQRVNAKLQPAPAPSPCARGHSCVCTSERERSVCSYAPAPRSKGL